MNPAALLTCCRPDFAERLPEAKRAIGNGDLRHDAQAAPFEIKQKFSPVMLAFPRTIRKSDKLLLAFRRRADNDQNALLFVFEPGLQVDAVSPDIDVVACRQIAPAPTGVLVGPDLLQPRDCRGRKTRCIRAEQGAERFGEVAGRDALEVEDRQQDLQAPGAPCIGRQDCRRKSNAACIVTVRCPIANTWWRTPTAPMPVMISRSGRWP